MPKSLPNRLRFSEVAVSRLRPPPSGEVIYWDALLPAFGLRVSHTGRKTWIVAVDGSKRRLGHFPMMTLAEARARLSGGATSGGPTSPTFLSLVEQFLEHGRTRRGRPLRTVSLTAYRRNLARYAKPLHSKRVAEITRRDIAALISGIAATSGGTTASLVRSILARVFGHAVATGIIDVNPVTATPSYEVPKRTRVLSDPEIAALWQATSEPDDYNLIVRLCLWCGVRRAEAGGLCWSELQDGVWTIPGARCKNHRDLVLPLASQTLDALARWPRVVGRDLLFGGRSPSGFAAWSLAKSRLDARLGLNHDFDVHDLRRTTQTRMVGLGISPHIVNRVMNHAFDPVTAAYDHHGYVTEKRDALQKWGDELDRIVTTHKPQVIPLAARAAARAVKGT